jgi:Domain of unknown function (DUF4112)
VSASSSNLDRLRRWTRLFDSAFRIPGTRITFGVDPLIGLIPGIGDLASPILTLLIVWHAAALRVPRIVLARMVLNAVIDGVVGAIPVLGDAFDFAWKANDWNLDLLERHAMPGTRASAGDWVFVTMCLALVAVAALIPLIVLVWLLKHLSPI